MIAALHQIEIAFTLLIQQMGSWLVMPMAAFTSLGIEMFYLLVTPTLFWCFSTAQGMRVGLMLLLTNGINSIFKISLRSPRPYWVDQRVKVLFQAETSFGLPSGHAQTAASVWGIFAAHIKDKWVRWLAAIMVFFIGFSRIYLGVHFTSDVLLGWLIGGLLVFAFLKLEQPVVNWFRRQPVTIQILAGFAVSAILLILVFIPLQLLAGWQIPAEWQQFSEINFPGSTVDPLNPEGVITSAGTLFGLIAGLAWIEKGYNGYNPAGTPGQIMLRLVVGFAGIGIFWYGLGEIFPREPGMLAYLLRYLRYALIGIWVTAAAPILFIKMRLAQPGWAVSKTNESSS
ncbi:MAG: phosphatase PAP2 family protein [Anaerolineaceae bacterium]|jgi:membrane-associated phospholipid phosphatase|nr:phosphatase PAP2 family protein [Anaerolineaceae bacterium]